MDEAGVGVVHPVEDSGRNHTQIVVAVISATATVIAAAIGIIMQMGNGSPARHSATQVAVRGSGPYNLSLGAYKLVDGDLKECGKSPPEEATNEWLTVSVPQSGADVGPTVTVEGTARLAAGNHLYLFSYAPDVCDYFFNPPMQLRPENRRWSHLADVRDNPGRTYLTAAIVDEQTDTLFQEIIQAMQGHEAPYVVRLPTSAIVAAVRVNVRA
jgi:hypothetical protein